MGLTVAPELRDLVAWGPEQGEVSEGVCRQPEALRDVSSWGLDDPAPLWK